MPVKWQQCTRVVDEAYIKELTAPVLVATVYYLLNCHIDGVDRYTKYIESKKDKKFLVLLADTIVNPRTVMVHLSDAPFAYLRKRMLA